MLKQCIQFYETARKNGIDVKTMTIYDNLKGLQKKIQAEEGRFYSLGELSDTIRYCHMWTR